MTHVAGAAATLTVRVLLFATYAELAGQEQVTVTVPGPATVSDVIGALRAQPWSARLPQRLLIAVNQVHAPLEQAVAEGDEVALLPPLAGG